MRFVACALVVAGIAFFASGCCCNPFACLPSGSGFLTNASADHARLDPPSPQAPVQVAAAHVDAQRF